MAYSAYRMPSILDLSTNIAPDPGLMDALCSEHSPAEALKLIVRLRERVTKNRTALKRHANEFEKAYEEAAHGGLDAEGLMQLAEAVRKAERGAAEQLHPWVEALREALAPRSEPYAGEAQQYLRELYDISLDWLAIYQGLREWLLKLASERRGGAGKVLRARPVAGTIDHGALSREFMARFPKIRAALAK
jgi:hypothetical protein